MVTQEHLVKLLILQLRYYSLNGELTFSKLLAEPEMYLILPSPQSSAHCAVWYCLIPLVSAGSPGIQVPFSDGFDKMDM